MDHKIFTINKKNLSNLINKELPNQFPENIFGRGNIEILKNPRVAIVGSRHPTLYGRETAYNLSRSLADAGFTILSGGAIGIDSIANRTAHNFGKSCAVIGCGFEHPHPSANRSFFSEIATSSQGLLLSEHTPETRAQKWMFPKRNRIIAMLADLVIVVEAAERSGSLITATLAIENNTDVGAVPGPIDSINSAGTNRLIQEGAFCITSADDVLTLLGSKLKTQAQPSNTKYMF